VVVMEDMEEVNLKLEGFGSDVVVVVAAADENGRLGVVTAVDIEVFCKTRRVNRVHGMLINGPFRILHQLMVIEKDVLVENCLHKVHTGTFEPIRQELMRLMGWDTRIVRIEDTPN
jgi:hypothetical protein